MANVLSTLGGFCAVPVVFSVVSNNVSPKDKDFGNSKSGQAQAFPSKATSAAQVTDLFS